MLSFISFIGLNFYQLTFCMLVYSFIGWAYESTIFSMCEQGRIMNRGCFIGPYCPIYGVVCIVNLYLLQGISSSAKIVFLGGLTCCFIEYLTSYILEKIFHARYWDYSYFPLNINGRVSVISGIFFGFALLFLAKILHPIMLIALNKMPVKLLNRSMTLVWVIFILDFIFTTIAMCNLNRKCKELYDAWDAYVDGKLDKINSKKDALDKYIVVEKGKMLVVKLKGFNAKFVDLETRYLKAYPTFISTKYSAVIDKMKAAIKKKETKDNDILGGAGVYKEDIIDENDDIKEVTETVDDN